MKTFQGGGATLERSADSTERRMFRPTMGPSMAKVELYLTIVSLGLLLLTCVEPSPVRELAVLFWLVSFAIVSVWNIGAGLGIYITSLALYSNFYVSGNFAFLGRPDHSALLVLVCALLLMRRRSWWIELPVLAIAAFLFYGIVNGWLTGTLSRGNLAVFARTFGIPLLLGAIYMNSRPTVREFRALCITLFVLAVYTAAVALAWQTELRGFIFPSWINDPTINAWGRGQRSGGILMQPAWNGLLLSMVLCLLYLAHQTWIRGYGRAIVLGMGALFLSAIFVTYTRAVYLGTIVVLTMLFWQASHTPRKTAIKRILLIGGGVIAVVLALFVQPSTLGTRVGDEATVEWRFEVWRVAARMVPQRPLFGYGFRGYSENAAFFLGESDLLTRGGLESSQTAVHNTFLQVLIEMGLIGFGLFLAILWLLFLRALRRSSLIWGKPGAMWLLAFVGTYLVQAQFAVVQVPVINVLFYGTLGLLSGLPLLRPPVLESATRR